MTRPRLFLVPVETLRGNRALEWKGTAGRCTHSPQVEENYHFAQRSGRFWLWLVSLTREAARTGTQIRPGGRCGW